MMAVFLIILFFAFVDVTLAKSFLVSILGCGHCKKAKPEFMEAAKHDTENSKVRQLYQVIVL